MNLKEAVAVAKQEVNHLFAPASPQDVRLETFLYDDHLAVWSLTIGFDLAAATRSSGSRKLTNPFYPSWMRSRAERSRWYGIAEAR
jgi:hypothetical protein